ncbi:MAG: InlB B-repeat-containing protein, partial [Clostridiales bacterium]|nr:InlB B-repeat-containing protein [Clostridiales bacterium]
MSNKLRSFLIVVISIAVVMVALPMNALRVNADTFTLYYNGNDGVRPISSASDDATKWAQVSDDQCVATVKDNSVIGFFKEGYAVVGWTDDSNGGGTTYTKGNVIPLTKDKTIYAQWAKAYSITFDPKYPDGATGTSGT